MIASSVILDVVIVAVVIILSIIGKKRGLFRTLAELVSYIVGWIAASVLAKKVSVAVAEWLRPWVEGKLENIAEDLLACVDLEQGFEEMISSLPEGLAKLFLDAGFAGKLEQLILGNVSFDFGPYVEELLQNIAYMLSFIVLFLIVMFFLRFLIKALDILTKLPVIHQLNAAGGVLIGALKGLVLVLLLLWLAGETGYLVPREAMTHSYIVPYLQDVFPFL